MTAESGVPAVESQNHDDETSKEEEKSTPQKKFTFPFYTKPVQRQKWGDTQIHPVVNWGDLFFDLFYVAAAYNLSGIVRASPTSEGLLYFVGCFWSVIMQWWDKMYYDSRFYTRDDLTHRIFEVCVIVTVATAIVHIRPVAVLSNVEDHVDMFAFCLALVLGTTLTMLRYLEMLVFGVEGEPVARVVARRDFCSKLIPWSFQVAAMSYAAYKHYGNHDDTSSGISAADETKTDGDHRLVAEEANPYDAYDKESTTNVPIWLLCGGALAWLVWMALLILTLPGGGKHKKFTVPMNVDFTIHRYGEWTMLMLGESILSLLIVEISDNVDYYVTFYAGILSVILLQYMHFRSQPHHPDEHAMRRSKEAGCAFSCLVQVYSAALIVLGVDYKMLLYEYTFEGGSHRRLFRLPRWLAESPTLPFDDDERRRRIAHFFCGSLAIVFFCSDAMILVHRGLKDNMGRCRCKHTGKTKIVGVVLILLRVGLIAFVATLSQYETDPEQLALIGLASIVAQLVLRVISSSVFPDDRVHVDFDSHGIGVPDDPEENKWPNVTHAQAEPGSDEMEESATENEK